MTCDAFVNVNVHDAFDYAVQLHQSRQAAWDEWYSVYSMNKAAHDNHIICRLWAKIFGKVPEYDLSIKESFERIRREERLLEARDILHAVQYFKDKVAPNLPMPDRILYPMPIETTIGFFDWVYRKKPE